jgi:AcrR family transcriptional regulator
MAAMPASEKADAEPAPPRRRYDRTSRQQGAAETRDRIVAAGCELLRASPIRDWQGLTVRAVADRAGVNERTVYRHFANERGLRDAVMHRLEQQAGIDLDQLELSQIGDVARRIVTTVATHPLQRPPPLDPSLEEAGQREHAALRRALEAHTAGWADADRTIAAAMFNLLWRVAVFEHLAVEWELDRDDAIAGITWVVDLMEQAVRDGRGPGAAGRPSS